MSYEPERPVDYPLSNGDHITLVVRTKAAFMRGWVGGFVCGALAGAVVVTMCLAPRTASAATPSGVLISAEECFKVRAAGAVTVGAARYTR